MSDNGPSVKLVATWLAQQAFLKTRPHDRQGARAYSLRHWRNYAGRAAEFLACRRALRESYDPQRN